MATETMLSPDQSVEAGTRLYGNRLVLFWIGWVLLVAYTLVVFFGSLPFYFTHLQTVCTRNSCVTGQPLASTVILLHGLGLTLANYALFAIMLTIIAAFIAFIIAGILVWRKPDDWMALLAALALVMLVTANSAYTLLQLSSPLASADNCFKHPDLEFDISCLLPHSKWTVCPSLDTLATSHLGNM